ncbi:MAG: sensor histidine kinase, partial [Bacteroidales bacterium]
LDGDKFQEHYDWLMEIPVAKNIFDDMEAAGMERPEWQKLHAAYFSKGYLVIITREPCPEEEVFKRFAKVFDQTYTRFLDLKKAEAQARESQIETALEKVRSRTMAMQHSDELIETSELMFEQIKNLDIDLWSCGFSLWYDDDSYFMGYNTGPDGKMGDPLKIPLTEDIFFTTIRNAKRRGDDFLVFESDGESLEETYSYMDTLPVVGEFMRGIVAAGAELPKYQVTHCGFFSHGHLMFIALEHNPEAIDIFKRFTKVFDQTYTRFLDLQKAEEQAREAQIEAALERVRSRAMAMHNSQELKEVALELRKQMGLLGQKDLEVCAIHLYGDGEDSFESWSAMKAPDSETEIVQTQANFPKKGIRIVDELMRHYNSESRDYVLVNEGEKIEEWFMVMENNAPELHASIMHAIGNASVNKLKANWSVADFSGGALVMVTYGDPDASSRNLLRRSANVFEQAYIRFLDLQKAEEQAREAKIEMSLEKIRSRTMGMQNSKELAEVIAQINAEITNLGIRSDNTTLITDIKLNEKSGSYCTWFSIPGKTYSNKFLLPKMRHPLYERTKEAYQKKIEFFTLSFTKKEKNRYLNFAFAESDLKFLPEERKEFLLNTPGLSQSVVLHKNSGLALQRFSNEAFSEEENAIAIRFGRVFEQTYTRFLDLQKAEAQAIEATKQASLDRVRGEIASMRSAKDLEIITPLIWNELTTLGIPFIRCGVFIIHEEDEQVEVYLSKPDGTSLAVMHLPFDSSELAIQTVDAWRKSSVYTQHWTREEFLDWGRSMMKQGQISDLETYQAAEEEPESLNLHFIPFNQGMLYVGTTESLSNEEIDLAVSLSEAFSIAYARYEDFIKLEKAKAGIEEALAELKATQSQLVQQEKLASLGQLTAGIAHEIKNPLNFVNNFSEVSEEMISELIEALGKGDIDESLALSKDIGANLKKIHEHGSRADGIVKSMLQHSRGGDGKMEPSPLNPIIKEYVNLAFHGMRAGKDPINVDIDLQLDESVGEVPLIAEDFSRVILNVCNNAFDAMREKLGKDLTGFENLSGLEGYHPKLTVRTKSENGTITIEIEDNGPGIPDEIKDKILQPFFTTKKGTQGTGLGLSITNDIIKAHGGKLSVNSTSGSGSTFIITLKP